jgi:hypothetical protein
MSYVCVHPRRRHRLGLNQHPYLTAKKKFDSRVQTQTEMIKLCEITVDISNCEVRSETFSCDQKIFSRSNTRTRKEVVSTTVQTYVWITDFTILRVFRKKWVLLRHFVFCT